MSVEQVLSSSSKVQVLRVLSNSSSAYSPKDLEKETTKNISVIYDAVRSLEAEDIIKTVNTKGKTSYYRMNESNPLAEQVKSLFRAERENYNLEDVPTHLGNIIFDVENRLRSKVEGLELILLFGSIPRGDFTPESDIDLYLVLDGKSTEKEDEIYDVLDNYDNEFSVIVKDREGYESDFVDDVSDLGRSIVLEGYSVIYSKMDESVDNLYSRIIPKYSDDDSQDELLNPEVKSEIISTLRDSLPEYRVEDEKE